MNEEIDSPYLFVGGKGRVMALRKRSGNVVWDVEHKKGGFLGYKSGKDFVTLVEGHTHLYAFSYGTAFCLSKSTGNIVWESEIKDLKHEIASLAVDANLLGAAHRTTASDTWVAVGSISGDGSEGGDGGGDGGGD